MDESFFIFYQVAMLASLLGCVAVAALVWRRRNLSGAKALFALVSATFIWTLGFLLEANSRTLERQLFFNNIGYLGLVSVPVFWLIFSVQYTNSGLKSAWLKLRVLFFLPLVITFLIWTNGYHHLMWSDEHLITSGLFLVTAKTYGPFFWVALTYNYFLVSFGAIFILQALLVGTSLNKRQAIALIIAAIVPLAWNTIYVFKLVPMPRKDMTPAAFAVSEIALMLGLTRFSLFRTVPFPRRLPEEQLDEGVLIFDADYRLREINPAACQITGVSKNMVGKDLQELSKLSSVFPQILVIDAGFSELSVTVAGRRRQYTMAKTPVSPPGDLQHQIGWKITLRQIDEGNAVPP